MAVRISTHSNGAGVVRHESIATTNQYLHYLGTGADKAGLDRLNEGVSDDTGATRGPRSEEDAS